MGRLGKGFEYEIVEIFRNAFPKLIEKIFRVWGSGSAKGRGKTSSDSQKEGDVVVDLDFLPKGILFECKHHQSRRAIKSFSLLKEVVDQARDEAERSNRFSVVAVKFKGAHPNNKELSKYSFYGKDANSIHAIIPISHLVELLRFIEDLFGKNYKMSNEKLMEILSKRLQEDS